MEFNQLLMLQCDFSYYGFVLIKHTNSVIQDQFDNIHDNIVFSVTLIYAAKFKIFCYESHFKSSLSLCCCHQLSCDITQNIINESLILYF